MSTTWIGETPQTGDHQAGDRAFERVFSLRPDLYEPLCEFSGLFWHRRLVEPAALELCRLRVAQLLGNQSELATRTRTAVDAGFTEDHVAQLAAWPTAPVFTAAQRACIAFAEQFVIDPQGVDPAMRDAVSKTSSEPELVALSEALAVAMSPSRSLMTPTRPSARARSRSSRRPSRRSSGCTECCGAMAGSTTRSRRSLGSATRASRGAVIAATCASR